MDVAAACLAAAVFGAARAKGAQASRAATLILVEGMMEN